MDNELYHYGRKGMKWYQNIFSKAKTGVARRKAERKKKDEETRKANIEKQKDVVVKSRSAKTVYENAHLFSDKELRAIYDRLTLENSIKNLIPSEVHKGERAIDKIIKAGNKTNDLLTTGTKLYESLSKFRGLFPKDAGDKSSGISKVLKKDVVDDVSDGVSKALAKQAKKEAKKAEKAAAKEAKRVEKQSKNTDPSATVNEFISRVQNNPVSQLTSSAFSTRKKNQAQLDSGDYDFNTYGRYDRAQIRNRWDDD